MDPDRGILSSNVDDLTSQLWWGFESEIEGKTFDKQLSCRPRKVRSGQTVAHSEIHRPPSDLEKLRELMPKSEESEVEGEYDFEGYGLAPLDSEDEADV